MLYEKETTKPQFFLMLVVNIAHSLQLDICALMCY